MGTSLIGTKQKTAGIVSGLNYGNVVVLFSVNVGIICDQCQLIFTWAMVGSKHHPADAGVPQFPDSNQHRGLLLKNH
jgi:hypothetical protein